LTIPEAKIRDSPFSALSSKIKGQMVGRQTVGNNACGILLPICQEKYPETKYFQQLSSPILMIVFHIVGLALT
jgi:hypothetical protein